MCVPFIQERKKLPEALSLHCLELDHRATQAVMEAGKVSSCITDTQAKLGSVSKQEGRVNIRYSVVPTGKINFRILI